MLKNHKQLLITQQKIARLQQALEETRKKSDPIAYKIQAEGVQSLINQMRAEVDEYLESNFRKFRSKEHSSNRV